MITQSKKLRGSVSFVSLSSLFHPRGQLILRLCSWSQNGHRLGLHVGILLVHIAVGERREKKRERKRRRGKTERREAIFSPAQWILNPFFQSTETIQVKCITLEQRLPKKWQVVIDLDQLRYLSGLLDGWVSESDQDFIRKEEGALIDVRQ